MNSNSWKRCTLADLVDPKRGISYGIVQPGEFLKEGGVPVLKVNNLTERKVDVRNVFRVSEEVEKKFGRTRLQGNEILVSIVGSLGHVHKVGQNEVGWNVVRAIAVLPIKEGVNRDWVYWCLRAPETQTAFENSATVTVQATLNIKELKGIEIPMPDDATQQKIASILSSLDDKIELNRQTAATLETMAQALFKEWFVELRFPGASEEMEENKAGTVPAGWSVCTLKDFGEIICGKTPSKSNKNYFDGPIPFIKIPDMHNSVFIVSTEDSLTEAGGISQKNKFIPAGSVVVSCIATVGLVALTSTKSQTNQQINSIVPKAQEYRYYLYFLLTSMQGVLRELGGGGSATLNVNTTTFSSIKVVLPERDVLRKFHEMLGPIFDLILENQNQVQTLIQLRDSLLPRLMKRGYLDF